MSKDMVLRITIIDDSEIDRLKDKANKKRVLAKKREIQKLLNKANKRLKRLEKANLKSSPAYQGLYREGGWTEKESRFGVKGKTSKEINKEYIRIKNFLNDSTSTVRGATKVLKETAKKVGLKYRTVRELKEITPKFFELVSKARQYLESSNRQAESLDYNKIFNAVNRLTKKGKLDLENVVDVGERVNAIINEIDDMM